LTHPYLARAWAKAGADLRVPAPGQARKVAMLGSLDHVAGGRNQIGTVAGFKSESPAGLRRNSHARVSSRA
jgi:hypothetical protein